MSTRYPSRRFARPAATGSDRQPASAPRPAPPPPTGAALRSLAFALLARREWSRHTLQDKLLQTGADPDEVAELLTELAASSYQSDGRMAQMLVREQVRKGRGPMRIRQELQKHKLGEQPEASQEASESMAEIDFLAQARALRARKFGDTLPDDPREKARQYRYLQYRGYDATTCSKALQLPRDED